MHLLTTVRTDTTLGFATYSYINLFIMPAFILMTGDFSKPNLNHRAIRSTLRLIVVWLAWEGIWALLHGLVQRQSLSETFLVVPAWTLWFLVTLATMRILLPYISRLKRPLLFSVVVALLAPLIPAIGIEFSAARTLAFMPFFVCGWVARERGWFAGDWFMRPTRRLRALAWTWLGIVAVALVAVPPLVSGGQGLAKVWRVDKWLTHRDNYEWLFANAPIGSWEPSGVAGDGGVGVAGLADVAGWIGFALGGMFVTALLMAVAASLTLALLLVVPRRRSIVSTWGTRTLGVYLLHAPIVWGLRQLGVIDFVGSAGWPGVVVLVVIACVLAALLSTGRVARAFRPIVEPSLNWLIVPKPRPKAE